MCEINAHSNIHIIVLFWLFSLSIPYSQIFSIQLASHLDTWTSWPFRVVPNRLRSHFWVVWMKGLFISHTRWWIGSIPGNWTGIVAYTLHHPFAFSSLYLQWLINATGELEHIPVVVEISQIAQFVQKFDWTKKPTRSATATCTCGVCFLTGSLLKAHPWFPSSSIAKLALS